MSYVPNTVEMKVLRAIARADGTPIRVSDIRETLDTPTKGHVHFALANLLRQELVETSYHVPVAGDDGYTGYRLTPKGEALPGLVHP